MLVLAGLMKNGVLPYNAYTPLLVLPPALYGIVEITVVSRHAWGPQRQRSSKSLWSFGKLSQSISPRSYAVYASAASTVNSCSSTVEASKLDSSLSMMKSPALSAAFALYVEKALCFESYKFLVDAAAYADGVYATPVEQVSTVPIAYQRVLSH
jgi:hypothetical protein